MKTLEETNQQTYQNVMELLVKEEIEKQLRHYPDSLVHFINKVEVATYALNRLPPLYASSEKGRNRQKLVGQQKFREQIKAAIRQGIAAVQRDPLRASVPLICESDAQYRDACTALEDLRIFLEERQLLDYQEVSWDNLVEVIKRSLKKVIWLTMSQQGSDASLEKATQWNDGRYCR